MKTNEDVLGQYSETPQKVESYPFTAAHNVRFCVRRVFPTRTGSKDADLRKIDEVSALGMVSMLVSSQPPGAEAHIVNPL
ncbi:hypothetical protein WN48_03580 [Eufriesea mexicana]|nr:hypothetical protein WN48_03580 [Eufriesea mexicana]